jgi:hydrogenase expression/formation protein HypC
MCLAVPGKVESIREEQGTRFGKVNFGGVIRDVCLAYVPDAVVGDYAIVHVGFALATIDEASALETLRTFAETGILDEEIAELRGESDADRPPCPTGDPGQVRP